jgi:hypothetical protein
MYYSRPASQFLRETREDLALFEINDQIKELIQFIDSPNSEKLVS